jgi:hypothetical protein
VSVVEQSYRRRADGVQVRPFSVRAGMQSRGYSLPLQRALSDFGADNAFGQVPQKMREHYGIEVSASAARTITEAHGAEMAAQQQAALEAELGPEPGWEWVLAEADGCMLPLVKPSATSTDKRKEKTLGWEEARLCLARPVGTVTARYAATLLGTVVGLCGACGSRYANAVALCRRRSPLDCATSGCAIRRAGAILVGLLSRE